MPRPQRLKTKTAPTRARVPRSKVLKVSRARKAIPHPVKTTKEPALNSSTVRSEALSAKAGSASGGKGERPFFEPFDLPSRHHVDQLIVMPRDPRWLYAYWELLPSTLEEGRRKLKEDGKNARLVLRLYEEETIHRYDVFVDHLISDWTLEAIPDRAWVVEMGLLSLKGEFVPLFRSNRTRTPPEGPSYGLYSSWREEISSGRMN